MPYLKASPAVIQAMKVVSAGTIMALDKTLQIERYQIWIQQLTSNL